jgi:hypothetical protein
MKFLEKKGGGEGNGPQYSAHAYDRFLATAEVSEGP